MCGVNNVMGANPRRYIIANAFAFCKYYFQKNPVLFHFFANYVSQSKLDSRFCTFCRRIFVFFFPRACFSHSIDHILCLGTQHSSGFTSTKMISGPIRLMHGHGITKSSFLPKSPKNLHGPGTVIALIHPSGDSISISVTNPSRRPSDTQITSLHRNSDIFMIIFHSSPFPIGEGYARMSRFMPRKIVAYPGARTIRNDIAMSRL